MEAKQLLFSCDYKTIGIIENQMLSVFSTDDIEYKNIIESKSGSMSELENYFELKYNKEINLSSSIFDQLYVKSTKKEREMLLFLLKKMEYTSKLKYNIHNKIKELEKNIKIDRTFNPFIIGE